MLGSSLWEEMWSVASMGVGMASLVEIGVEALCIAWRARMWVNLGSLGLTCNIWSPLLLLLIGFGSSSGSNLSLPNCAPLSYAGRSGECKAAAQDSRNKVSEAFSSKKYDAMVL